MKPKEVRMQLSFSSDLPEYLYADKSRICQVIVNLCENAILYSPDNDDVSFIVDMSPDNSKLRIYIQNSLNYELNRGQIDQLYDKFF